MIALKRIQPGELFKSDQSYNLFLKNLSVVRWIRKAVKQQQGSVRVATKKKIFLAMILVRHWNTWPGEGVGSSLLGLEEQDRQASVKNDQCILSCLAARYGLAFSCLIFNGSVHTQAVWSLSWILLGIYVSLSCPFLLKVPASLRAYQCILQFCLQLNIWIRIKSLL